MDQHENADLPEGAGQNQVGAGKLPEYQVLGGPEMQQLIQRMIFDQVNARMAAANNALVPAAVNPPQAAAQLPTTSRFNWGNNTVLTSEDMVSFDSDRDTSENNNNMNVIDLTLCDVPQIRRDRAVGFRGTGSGPSAESSTSSSTLKGSHNKAATNMLLNNMVDYRLSKCSNTQMNQRSKDPVAINTPHIFQNTVRCGSETGTPNNKNRGKRQRDSPLQQTKPRDSFHSVNREGASEHPPAKRARIQTLKVMGTSSSQPKITRFLNKEPQNTNVSIQNDLGYSKTLLSLTII